MRSIGNVEGDSAMTYDRIALIALTSAAVAFGAARAVTPTISILPATYSVAPATQLADSTVGVFILKNQAGTPTIYYCSAPTKASATEMTSCRGQKLP
jgi:hypothetical protein